MDFYEVVRRRRSVRSFLPRDVSDEKVRRIIATGLAAQSAKNRQPWRFIVVRDAAAKKALAKAAKNQHFIAEAPVVLAACAVDTDYVMTCGQPAYTVDVSIAVDHITLAAVVEGLSSCWIGAFHEDKAKEVLGVPDTARIVALLPMGYAASSPEPTSRGSFEDRVAKDTWPEAWNA
ncbi:nitroreductase family protein [Candidatus Fermentibacteria bacterium]|nr:nitroreductase family protein [Candidatus Fermentibacteria bacterium]